MVQDRTDPDGQALPGAFLRERATVAASVADVFRRKVGVEPSRDVHPRLLRLFDDPDRDSRTWAISAAHAVSMREGDLESATGTLVPVDVDGRLADGGPLLFDHDAIVSAAVRNLRERYEFRHRYADTLPDPDGFLAEPFTLYQLRKVHEAVIGGALHKDNFNRRMKPFVEPVLRDGEPVFAEGVRGRPAGLYHRLSNVDRWE
ncbi:NrtR DNA-binding winged helix domain-containing protein [Gordonia crocea]|uniref:NrtR DNA-binding winged helix domain-containing protein n=1 Tax=Gordonia crocea TaxID=589162 RepID=UPI001E392D9B|nr:NUDIX hydrolase [Gordonia crocea]